MPLFDTRPTDVLPVTPTNTDKISVNSSGIYTGNNVNIHLFTHIDGTPYTSTFYNQVIGTMDPVNNSSDITDPTLKQYLKILNLELRLTTQLSHNDVGNGKYTVTGGCSMYPVKYMGKTIVPQIGDRFTALIEGNQYGDYELTNVVRASPYADSVWEVTFSLLAYSNNRNLDVLENYVVETLIYDKSYLSSPTGPLRTVVENAIDIDKDSVIKELVSMYYNEYFNSIFGTFLFTKNGYARVFDANIINLWNRYLGYTDGTFKLPKEYLCNINYSKYKFKTVFDVIINRSMSLMPKVVKAMAVIPQTYSAMIKVPQDVSNMNLGYYIFPKQIDDLILFDRALDEVYIFSKEFYSNEALTIPLEILLRKFILHETIPYRDVKVIVDNVYTLTTDVRFYYTPFILLLLKVSV